MKNKSYCIFALAISTACLANGQGSFIYDQQSSTDEGAFPPGTGATIQLFPSPYGQSFTPAFAGIDFVKLNVNDPNPGNSLGATLAINLRTNSINGLILATTVGVSLTNGFSGVATFLFAGQIPLTPGVTYYFQPVVQSGDSWNALIAEFNYAGGSLFSAGNPSAMSDFWFREGVIPEPSSVLLLLTGGGFFYLRGRRKEKVSKRCQSMTLSSSEAISDNLVD